MGEDWLNALMQNAYEQREFMLLYGRPPEPGEIESIKQENRTLWAIKCAKAAIRPGFVNMLKYWVNK